MTRRIPALDAVRGVAILMVMATHLTVWTPTNIAEAALYGVLDAGWVGVDLFFVLSGYLINGILIDTRGQPDYYRRFYARRFLRIFPPYYVTLTVLTLVGVAVTWHYWFYLSNVYIPTLGSWHAAPYTGHLWSLALEEQFYLVWPLVIAVASPRVRVPLFAALALASWSIRAAGVTYGQPDMLSMFRVDPLAIGALLAVWKGRRVHLVVPTVIGAIAIGVGSKALLFATFIALFAVVVSRAATTTRTGPLWLQHVGRVSYTMYLVHLPIHVWIVSRWPVHSLASQLAHWLIVGSLTYGIAALSWHFVESRILNVRLHWPRTRQSIVTQPDRPA